MAYSASVWLYGFHCFAHVRHRANSGTGERGRKGWNLESRRRAGRRIARPLRTRRAARFRGCPPLRRCSSGRTGAAKAASPVAHLSLFDLRPHLHHLHLAGHHCAFVARARAAAQPRAADAERRRPADRAARSDQGSAGRREKAQPADTRGVRRDRGPAVLQPLGHRPARNRAGDARQFARRRGPRGRKHDYPAACEDELPVEQPHHPAQGAGGHHRLLAGRLADQAGDPLALFVERLFRRRRLWPARRRAPLFQPRSRQAQSGPVGDARGNGPGAFAPGSDATSRGRTGAQPAGPQGDGQHRRHQPRARRVRRRSHAQSFNRQNIRPAPISQIGSRRMRRRRSMPTSAK